MKKPASNTIILVAGLLVLCVISMTGCGGGGAASSTDGTGGTSTVATKTLSWSPPSAYQDNSPLNPAQDLAGYNIYIKNQAAPFSDQDAESAFSAPADTSLNLIPVCNLLGLPPGTYHVSVRAIAKNGMMSDFSPTASFTL